MLTMILFIAVYISSDFLRLTSAQTKPNAKPKAIPKVIPNITEFMVFYLPMHYVKSIFVVGYIVADFLSNIEKG